MRMRPNVGLYAGIVITIMLISTFFSFTNVNGIEDDTVLESFAGGSGTLSDPYQITNLTQLQEMKNNLTAHYKLMNDINASSTRDWNEGDGFEPIAGNVVSSGYDSFSGTFNGNGKEITGLFINRTGYSFIGLFGATATSSSISNLTLNKVDVSGKQDVGALVGKLEGKIYNCHVKGSVYGNTYTGGLAGYTSHAITSHCSMNGTVIEGEHNNRGFIGGLIGFLAKSTVSNCHAESLVTGSFSIGGLIGYCVDSEITQSSSFSDVTGEGYTGGLVGTAIERDIETDISDCFSSSIITSNWISGGLIGTNGLNEYQGGDVGNCISIVNITNDLGTDCGGLIGMNCVGSITDCSADGIVRGQSVLGGLIGTNGNDNVKYQLAGGKVERCYSHCEVPGSYIYNGGLIGSNCVGLVKNCFSTGFTSGDRYVGGLIGSNDGYYMDGGDVEYCYSSGEVNYTGYSKNMSGGLIGISSSSVKYTGCFWDNETSTFQHSAGGTGLQTSDMSLKSTFTKSGWNFNTIWDMVDKRTYPYFEREGNVPVVIIGADVNMATEDSLYENRYGSFDPDVFDASPLWSLTTDCDWLNIDDRTGRLWGIPRNDDVGTWSINISALDGGGAYDYREFDITVENVNDPPTILTEPVTSAMEDELYSVRFEAEDMDPTDDTWTWDLETDAHWLSLNSNNGTVSGTPGDWDVGQYSLNLSVFDNNDGSSWINYNLEVLNVNDDPRILNDSLPDMIEDQSYSAILDGSDIDPTNDTLSWSIDTDLKCISIDVGTGEITGVPTNDDVGIHQVNITLEDGQGGSVVRTLDLEIINVNDDPEIITGSLPEAVQGFEYSFTMDAEDIDPTDDDLQWGLVTNATFLSINGDTGEITGVPENDDIGEWILRITVADGNGGSDEMDFILVVRNQNDIPEMVVSEIVLEMSEDPEEICWNLSEYFIDIDNDVLEYDSDSSHNLTILIYDNMMYVQPRENWYGEENVILNVSDGHNSIEVEVKIVVTPVNDPPHDLVITCEDTCTSGDEMAMEATASDPDMDSLTFTWSSNISGEIGTGPSILVSLPVGQHLISVEVSDGEMELTGNRTILIKAMDNGTTGDPDDDNETTGENDGKESDKNGNGIVIVIVVAVILLVLVAAGAFLLMKFKKKGDETESEDVSPEVEGNDDPETGSLEP